MKFNSTLFIMNIFNIEKFFKFNYKVLKNRVKYGKKYKNYYIR